MLSNSVRLSRASSRSSSNALTRRFLKTTNVSSTVEASFLQKSQKQHLWRTTSSYRSYSSYEYPFATEAPEIVRTTAQEARQKQETPTPTPTAPDNDDQEAYQAMKDQVQQLCQEVQETTRCEPIQAHVLPSYLPANAIASTRDLPEPQAMFTTLDNGIRVVSQETYGQGSSLGVVANIGSRYNTIQNQAPPPGFLPLLELLAFGSSTQFSAHQVTQFLQDDCGGGTRFVTTGREQSMWGFDLLRDPVIVKKAMQILSSVLLEPQFLPDEIAEAQQTLQYLATLEHMPPETILSEALYAAAYGGAQQSLGRSHFITPTLLHERGNLLWDDLQSRSALHDFWKLHFLGNPEKIVLCAVGMAHEPLVELVQEHFGHLQQAKHEQQKFTPCVYKGGEERISTASLLNASSNNAVASPEDGLIRVALALPVGGWHEEEPSLVATCVLQTLLGGGSSFSAGGPGKGMYSRLYRQVLNRYSWAESAEAFTAFHAETGLWGISASTPYPHKARDMVQVMAEHLARLAVEPVSDEELVRARNMLKCNVLTQLESRLVLLEDLGRQVLTYDGRREDIHTTCEKINAVTQQDVQTIAQRALKHPPTLAAVGSDLSHVPWQAEVARWFK